MILGIGTDLAVIERIGQTLERRGERFARRILTDNELERFRNHPHQVSYLAKRFAAKEAAAKAIGTGIGKLRSGTFLYGFFNFPGMHRYRCDFNFKLTNNIY